MFGLIREVDSDLSDEDIAQHLRSPDQRVAKVHRPGNSSNLKLTFYGIVVPRYILLGHVGLAVFSFEVVQCNVKIPGGKTSAQSYVKRPTVCGRCGAEGHGQATCSAVLKCITYVHGREGSPKNISTVCEE